VRGAGTISEMKNLECISLFVEDLAASKEFYLEIFDLKIVYEDPISKPCSFFKLRSSRHSSMSAC
jgi:catechol 2,3-dioxygenase-like lactoylglutathione lyase family enzyme